MKGSHDMPDPIVLDTSAISDQGFRGWLFSYRGRKILPMVAFVEFSVFLRSRNRTHAQIMQVLRKLGIEIEPFGQKQANTAVDTSVQTRDFKKNWRDHMIAGHAHTPPLRLITYNVDDFRFLGNRVLTPESAMKEL
jgi:predicted nucleic acid-binding protein